MGANPQEIASFVLIDLAVIIVTARLVGGLFKRMGQPAVVGEILGGVLLGPTVLGALPGDLSARLFPAEVRPFLLLLAQLGLIIFMFIVGLELDVKLLRGNEKTAVWISFTSTVVPFVLGALLGSQIFRYHRAALDLEDPLPFVLFMGACMSVTAFPVLARLLMDRGMHRTQIGALSLACAAANDFLAWTMLAVVVAIVESEGVESFGKIMLMSGLFVATMLMIVRPLLRRLPRAYRESGKLTPTQFSVIAVGILLSAYATERIGIHSIFGAFMFGTVMPRERARALVGEILVRLEQVSSLLLLPVFFVATGLDVDLGSLGPGGPIELLAIVAVACVGKFAGAVAGARVSGISFRRASTLGVLMNTRGLTELVILNVGLSKGVLDADLFTMLVVMALVTTLLTEPLLRVVYPKALLEQDLVAAEQAEVGELQAYRVVVAVREPQEAALLLPYAVALARDEPLAEVLLSRFMPTPEYDLELGSGLAVEVGETEQSLDALGEVARQGVGLGVECTSVSRFSGDFSADVLAQAAAVQANILIVGPGVIGDPESSWDMPEGSQWHLLVFASFAALDGDGPVLARLPPGAGVDAILEVAVRLSRSRSQRLLITRPAGTRRLDRRIAELVAEFRHLGVTATVGNGSAEPGDADPAPQVVVASYGSDSAWRAAELIQHAGSTLILVCPAQTNELNGLDAYLELLDR